MRLFRETRLLKIVEMKIFGTGVGQMNVLLVWTTVTKNVTVGCLKKTFGTQILFKNAATLVVRP